MTCGGSDRFGLVPVFRGGGVLEQQNKCAKPTNEAIQPPRT